MTSAPLRRAGGSDAWILGLAAVLAAWLYFGTALEPSTPWFTREPSGYYGLQTAGFRAGHLSAAIVPHPALLALRNPYDPVANAPFRVHDMSLFGGRYYLYYGVSPILIAFWPCVALTGWYPSEPVVVAAFCTGAVWLGLAIIAALRRRYFPAATAWALALGALCLVLANPLDRLVEAPQFYQVAIAGAVFLQMAMLMALYGCLHSRRHALLWLAGASGIFGLSVGARPSYLPGGLGLVLAAAALARRTPPGSRVQAAWRILLAAALPAAACGIGLMTYNWLRFGAVSEFGMRYALAGRDALEVTLFHPRFVLPSLLTYLFSPGHWSGYFPFFAAGGGQPYGFLRYTLWAWMAPLALVCAPNEDPGSGPYRWFSRVLTAVVLGNLLLLAAFLGTNERYSCDFACGWLLLSGTGALALSHRAALRRWKLGIGGWLGALAALSLGTALAIFIAHAPAHLPLVEIGRAANWPAYVWRRAHGQGEGALRITLQLSQTPRDDIGDPLFETGLNDGECDWWELDYLAGQRARVAFHHAGIPEFLGDPFLIPGDRRLVIEARSGSLLPPFDHPAFAHWTRSDFDSLARDVRVSVNGTESLRVIIRSYPASPSNLTIGRMQWTTGGVARQFSGRVLAAQRLPVDPRPSPLLRLSDSSPLELSVRLPAQHNAGGDPLLVTGQGTASDLLYSIYDGHGRIRFALDHFGYGGPQSEWVPYDPLRPHALTVWMGSLARPGIPAGFPPTPTESTTIPWSRRLVVRFDGRTLLNTEQEFYAGTPASAEIGVNPYGSTVAGFRFSGLVERVTPLGFPDLPPLLAAGAYGEVRLTLRFPTDVPGSREPLVVSGVAGAGDLLYVSYVDSSHVAVGFDHWGVGGFLGRPIKLDYGKPHRVGLTMGSLYPPGASPEHSTLVRVTIDGQVALEGRSPCHPSSAPQIRIGFNPIGGSTCGPAFTGQLITEARRSGPGP